MWVSYKAACDPEAAGACPAREMAVLLSSQGRLLGQHPTWSLSALPKKNEFSKSPPQRVLALLADCPELLVQSSQAALEQCFLMGKIKSTGFPRK